MGITESVDRGHRSEDPHCPSYRIGSLSGEKAKLSPSQKMAEGRGQKEKPIFIIGGEGAIMKAASYLLTPDS
jgi:hypothetical protein